MDETYTVQSLMTTGKTHATYGTEYYVKFAESENTFKLWFKKNTPKEGDKIEGRINGSDFKKAKKEYVTSQTESGAKPKRTYGAVEKDKQDGMRQGMAYNNAANYVNDHSTAIVEPPVWAKTVFGYAKALYEMGDLNTIPPEEAPKSIEGSSVKDIA